MLDSSGDLHLDLFVHLSLQFLPVAVDHRGSNQHKREDQQEEEEE